MINISKCFPKKYKFVRANIFTDSTSNRLALQLIKLP